MIQNPDDDHFQKVVKLKESLRVFASNTSLLVSVALAQSERLHKDREIVAKQVIARELFNMAKAFDCLGNIVEQFYLRKLLVIKQTSLNLLEQRLKKVRSYSSG